LKAQAGFSLLEVLVATAITVGIGAAAFQLFHQNERIFRDQALILEMQQSARVVAAQATDDIRQAGQGIPTTVGDVILPGSNTARLNVRTGFSTTEASVTSAMPLPVAVGSALSVLVESTAGFSGGRQAFLWTENDWARVTINSVSGPSKSVRATPSLISKASLVFASPPTLSLDEAISIYRDTATQTVRRTTATNTEVPTSPMWAPANELATNVTDLSFLYYDRSGALLTLDTPIRRSQVAVIEAHVSVRTSASLSDGSRPTYSLSVRAIPRNLER
jgi:prepilin-type N-terminal cleavage/methylation domain-containing protein